LKTTISYKKIWNIAYPIILGSVAQNLINVTDTAFLGRVGEIALGAGAIGGIYYIALVMLAFGFGIGTQIIIARRNGEQDFESIGKTFEHALYFLIPLAILMFSVMKFFSDEIMGAIVTSDAVYNELIDYVGYRSYGLFFVSFNVLFRAFYVGIARTKVITWSTIVMAVVNIFLDYALIFGNFGFPEMGIEGAALASVIAEATALVFFVFYTLILIPRSKYLLFYFVPFNLSLFKRIVKVAFPVMMQNFISLSAWLTFFLLVEKMGERELAVSNIIRSFYVVLMIPMWGFSSATNTLVSYVIGEGKDKEVLSLVYKIAKLCVAGVAIIVIIGSIFPELALRIYTNDLDLIRTARPVLYVVNVSALLLATAFVFFNGVSGTGKTQVSFLIEVIVISLYLIITYLLVNVIKGSITVVWASEFAYATLMALFSWLYLKYGKWRGRVV